MRKKALALVGATLARIQPIQMANTTLTMYLAA
jgi:hypothetical protein